MKSFYRRYTGRRVFSKRNIVLVTIACAILHVARIYQRGFIEDPDIGSFIVIAQSYLSGDSFYTDFFDPKLPHILPVYSLSALIASTAGHLTVTLCCIVATGLIILHSGKNIWGGLFYISLTLISPGGATGHLSIYSNFFVAFGYYCLSEYQRREARRISGDWKYAWLIVSAGLVGYAVGLRPNYGFALAPIVFWFACRYRISIRIMLVWIAVCIGSFTAPIAMVWFQSGISPLDLMKLFSAWNKSFYIDQGPAGLIDSIYGMYSHRIGFLNLGIIVMITTSSIFISARRWAPKIVPFAISLSFIWLSYYVSHIYNHYVLMDLLLISFLISSVRVRHDAILPFIVLICLWIILVISPMNGHSKEDALLVENKHNIIQWIKRNKVTELVSPTWLTPHWITWSKVPTIGIHPVWSIGLLDRYDFKKLSIANKFRLDPTWDAQCQDWMLNTSSFIGPQKVFDRCKPKGFKLVREFKDYPLKVWIKK